MKKRITLVAIAILALMSGAVTGLVGTGVGSAVPFLAPQTAEACGPACAVQGNSMFD